MKRKRTIDILPRMRRDGIERRKAILRWMRENPGASKAAIARGVGLAVNNYASRVLESHLSILEARGAVRRVGLRAWEVAIA